MKIFFDTKIALFRSNSVFCVTIDVNMKNASEKNLWKWFSIYIRIRDAEPFSGLTTCVTCGRKKHWRDMDCGHGIPRQHKATKYHEQNNHAQCKRCNAFEGGRMDQYMIAVDQRYGVGTWDKLIVLSRTTSKRNSVDWQWMSDHYKREAQQLAKRKSLTI